MSIGLPRPVLHVAALALVCAACAGGQKPHAPATSAASPSVRPTAGQTAKSQPSAAQFAADACDGTVIHSGPPPSWNPAPAGFSEQPPTLPYVVGSDDSVMGYLWVHPLYTPESGTRSNKILWYVRYPRDGSPLVVTGRLRSGHGRTVRESFPDNSTPGEIYPSDITVPRPGCWSFTLRWAGHTDRVDLLFTRLPGNAS